MSLSERMWPTITNSVQARAASQNGAGVTFFIAGVTTVCALLAIVLGHSVLGIDGIACIDGLIFGVVGWRLTKESFPWAVFGLAMYLVEKWYQFTASNSIKHPAGVALTIIFTAALVASVRGTYFLRAERKNTGPQDKSADLQLAELKSPVL